MEKNKTINIEHIFVHSIFQMMAAIVYGFGIFMLMERGYNSAQAGICLALTSALNLLISPILSNFLDNSKKYSIFEVIPLVGGVVLVLYIINYFLTGRSILLSIIFVLGNGAYALMESLINSYSSTFQKNGIDIGFSSARAAGSLSYGIMCAIFGVLSVKYSYYGVVIGGIIFSLLLLIATIAIRKSYYKVRPYSEVKEDYEGISFKKFVINNKLFLILCIFLTGIFLGYTCVDNFMLLVVQNVGGTSNDMGTILGIKAVIEAVAVFLFPIFLKKVKLENLLIISAFTFICKALAIYLALNITIIYLAQIFQALSFGFVLPGIVEYVYKYMSEKEAVRGNACFTMTISLGSMVSSLIGGIISNSFGVSMMELIALIITIVSCAGFIVVLLKLRKINNAKV